MTRRRKQGQEGVPVKSLPRNSRVQTGKPRKVITSSLRTKTAYSGYADVMLGSGGNFYSPEMSTDFLERPQSLAEKRAYYRWFYHNDPYVARAIDLHTELPLSRIRLDMPEAKDMDLARKAYRFCKRWANDINLLDVLESIIKEYHLIGEVFIWAEDGNPDPPEELMYEDMRIVDEDGSRIDKVQRRDTAPLVEWMTKNYKGWTNLAVLSPDYIVMKSYPFTDEVTIALEIPSDSKNVVELADQGDLQAKRVVASMPEEIVTAIRENENVILGTDPDAGSFCYYMARKKSPYEERGHSLLERCLGTLIHRDKLRQAQASIASRHMTPYRIVYGENLSMEQTEDLRAQVDWAMMDPDYSIITNFPVTWEERDPNGRLLDLSSEYDLTERQLYAGLGVTEGLLSGDSAYSGSRISLEIINQQYMQLRLRLQDFVDEYLLKPMCRRMGFIEDDEDGNERVIYPHLSFTRMALRDNADSYDMLYNLYVKGSLDIDTLYDFLNIDPTTAAAKIKKDMFTVNDPMFNEFARSAYSRVADLIVEHSDLAKRLAEYMNLTYEKKEEGGGRF